MPEYDGSAAVLRVGPEWVPARVRGTDGVRIALSPRFDLFAVPPRRPDPYGYETWQCRLLQKPHNRLCKYLAVGVAPCEHPSAKILEAVARAVEADISGLRPVLDAAWNKACADMAEPAVPVKTEPRPDVWYDPRRNVPYMAIPVLAAWTSATGVRHPADRTFVYADGIWYWDYARQDEMPFMASIDAWTGCPARPPEWRR